MITNEKETVTVVPSHKCPNPSCGKSFAKPLKAVNLNSENPAPYPACPHCLTDIASWKNQSTADTAPVSHAKALKPAKGSHGGEKTEPQPTKTACTHHFGYLSERSNKEKIPEECMACAEIVNCMLKAVKSRADK